MRPSLLDRFKDAAWSAQEKVVWPIADATRRTSKRIGRLGVVAVLVLVLAAGGLAIGVIDSPFSGDGRKDGAWPTQADRKAEVAGARYAELWAQRARGAGEGELDGIGKVATAEAAAQLVTEAVRRDRSSTEVSVAELTSRAGVFDSATVQARLSSPRRDTMLVMRVEKVGGDWMVTEARHQRLR